MSWLWHLPQKLNLACGLLEVWEGGAIYSIKNIRENLQLRKPEAVTKLLLERNKDRVVGFQPGSNPSRAISSLQAICLTSCLDLVWDEWPVIHFLYQLFPPPVVPKALIGYLCLLYCTKQVKKELSVQIKIKHRPSPVLNIWLIKKWQIRGLFK